MKLIDLPFIHFLVRSGSRDETTLTSPLEVEFPDNSGGFFAPVQEDGRLFPHYRFHFAFYIGEGEFLNENGKKKLLTGVAVRSDSRDRLTLLFGLLEPEPWRFPPFSHYPSVPALLATEDEFFIPTLDRVPRRQAIKYTGIYTHRDFESKFIELHPTDIKTFDTVLIKFRISLIGYSHSIEDEEIE